MKLIIANHKMNLLSNDIDEYIGIKSDLEAMYSEVDLQLSYINRRRLL
jgi:hypothetical protein